MIWHGELVEHVLHICRDSIGVAAESVYNSPQGVVAVGSLTESVINTDISGPCGRVKHYSGLAFLFDGELTIGTNPCAIQDVFEETKLVLGISWKLVLFPPLDGRG